MRTPKLVLNNTVLFITTSVEEGFMFPPNPLINLVIKKCFASAQALYPVKVCHFLVSTTHLHLLVVVENPDDIKDFMRHFKAESAHAINRLLGRSKRTIWCEGYDSPVLVSAERVMKSIKYLYLNVAQDNLEDSIDRFPGVNSWRYFCSGKTRLETCYIPRDEFRALPKRDCTLNDFDQEARILKRKKKKALFEIYPDAWMDVFQLEEAERKEVNAEIRESVLEAEELLRSTRKKEKRTVIGVSRLLRIQVGAPYTPKRLGKKMICHGVTKEERAEFISYAKGIFQRGREVYQEWKRGNLSVPYPLGLYAPNLPKVANLAYALE